ALVSKLTGRSADCDGVPAPPPARRAPPAWDPRARYGAPPVSPGPSRFAATVADVNPTVVLVRNRFWDRRTDPVRAALPDRIELTTGLAPGTRDDWLIAGRADLDLTGSGLQPVVAAPPLADPTPAGPAGTPPHPRPP